MRHSPPPHPGALADPERRRPPAEQAQAECGHQRAPGAAAASKSGSTQPPSAGRGRGGGVRAGGGPGGAGGGAGGAGGPGGAGGGGGEDDPFPRRPEALTGALLCPGPLPRAGSWRQHGPWVLDTAGEQAGAGLPVAILSCTAPGPRPGLSASHSTPGCASLPQCPGWHRGHSQRGAFQDARSDQWPAGLARISMVEQDSRLSTGQAWAPHHPSWPRAAGPCPQPPAWAPSPGPPAWSPHPSRLGLCRGGSLTLPGVSDLCLLSWLLAGPCRGLLPAGDIAGLSGAGAALSEPGLLVQGPCLAGTAEPAHRL